MPRIVLDGLTKRYGRTLAVDHLSVTIEPGHVTGFLGPNGAGKSTTMRMIIGLDRPSAGTALVDGRRFVDMHRPLRHLGAVLDARTHHGGRSAYHHLLYLAQSNGLPARRVDEVLDLVGLSDVARRRAGGFSLGMSQRLGLAGALLGDPPILLCDEPVNGLDPEGILWIRTLLRRLAAEGRAVFVSSHLMSEMALTADRLIVIGRGRLLADASTSDIISASSRRYVHVRSDDAPRLTTLLENAGAEVTAIVSSAGLQVRGLDTDAVGRLAAGAGITVLELAGHEASLEEAFMELTRDSVQFGATGAVPA